MKKIVSILVAAVMALSLLMPLAATADQIETLDLTMTADPTGDTIHVDDTVTFTVTLNALPTENVKSVSVEVVGLPSEDFSFESGSWGAAVGSPILSTFDTAKGKGALTYMSNTAITTGVLFTFSVKALKATSISKAIDVKFTLKTKPAGGSETPFAEGEVTKFIKIDCATGTHVADDAHWFTDDNGHYRKCSLCGQKIEETYEAHKGGTATCQAKAQCEVCFAEYGSLAEHQYTVSQHDNDNHWLKCANCESTTTPEPHEGTGMYIDKDNDHHCQFCSCGVQVESEHRYDNACDDTCNDCGHTRTVPGHNWVEVVDSKYIVTEKKCNEYAIYSKSCSECGISSAGITGETFYDVAGGYADHNVNDVWYSNPDQHWHECQSCHDYKEGLGNHDFQNIILADRINEVEGQPGVFHKVCLDCLYVSSETFDEVAYEITEGANAKYAGKGDLVIKSNMQNFQRVVVDDVTVEVEHNFTDGLTLTLPEAFLKTLAKGDHKVVVYGWDGQAETTITVTDAEPANPGSGSETGSGNATGDSANVALWLSVFVLSVVALGFTLIVNKKKAN